MPPKQTVWEALKKFKYWDLRHIYPKERVQSTPMILAHRNS